MATRMLRRSPSAALARGAPGHARGRTGPGGEAPEADYCLPRFQYDLVEVYSPTLVDELRKFQARQGAAAK